MTSLRIELTFSSGKFIAFKDVDRDSVKYKDGMLTFIHGDRKDFCYARMDSLDFVEMMEIPVEED